MTRLPLKASTVMGAKIGRSFLPRMVLLFLLLQLSASAQSTAPTNSPTNAPTNSPTNAPTNSPTKLPTSAPTKIPTSAPTKIPTSAPTKIPTSAPTKIPTSAPTSAPVSRILKVVANNGLPRSLCQGDCNSDSDCLRGLKCFQRKKNEVVPGCTGDQKGYKGIDFCYAPPTRAPTRAPTKKPTRAPTNVPVPVTSSPTKAPAPKTASPTRSPAPGILTLIRKSVTPFGLCQGDCNVNTDCASGLVCFQRKKNEPVPGCVGDKKAFKGADFCIQA